MINREVFELIARTAINILLLEKDPQEFASDLRAAFGRKGRFAGLFDRVTNFGSGLQLVKQVGPKRVSIIIRVDKA